MALTRRSSSGCWVPCLPCWRQGPRGPSAGRISSSSQVHGAVVESGPAGSTQEEEEEQESFALSLVVFTVWDSFLTGLGHGDNVSPNEAALRQQRRAVLRRHMDKANKAAGSNEQQNEMGSNEEKDVSSFLTSLRKFIGSDIMNITSLPISFMEPLTSLQRCAEVMEYSHLLDQAAKASDPLQQMSLTTAFLYSLNGCIERVYKPFDPILGETYQFDLPCGGRFISEQVCHHPPISVAHAENDLWEYDLISAPKTVFYGNSLAIFPDCCTRIRFKRTGTTFCVVPPLVCVYGILIQRMWLDVYGHMAVVDTTTGTRCDLDFKPCGWFGHNFHEAEGHVRDAAGVPRLRLEGMWNSYLRSVACDEHGTALEGCDATTLWECSAKPAVQQHSLTTFATEVLSGPFSARTWPLLRSDSRLRPDRRALQLGESRAAQERKPELEQRQRREAKRRGSAKHTPRWFVPLPNMRRETAYGECSLEAVPGFGFGGRWPDHALPSTDLAVSNGCESVSVSRKQFHPWEFEE